MFDSLTDSEQSDSQTIIFIFHFFIMINITPVFIPHSSSFKGSKISIMAFRLGFGCPAWFPAYIMHLKIQEIAIGPTSPCLRSSASLLTV